MCIVSRKQCKCIRPLSAWNADEANGPAKLSDGRPFSNTYASDSPIQSVLCNQRKTNHFRNQTVSSCQRSWKLTQVDNKFYILDTKNKELWMKQNGKWFRFRFHSAICRLSNSKQWFWSIRWIMPMADSPPWKCCVCVLIKIIIYRATKRTTRIESIIRLSYLLTDNIGSPLC